jgi:hypothetical protein
MRHLNHSSLTAVGGCNLSFCAGRSGNATLCFVSHHSDESFDKSLHLRCIYTCACYHFYIKSEDESELINTLSGILTAFSGFIGPSSVLIEDIISRVFPCV